MIDGFVGTFPAPPAGAPHIDRVQWERRVARSVAQSQEKGGPPIKALERRYGKPGLELAEIAKRHGVNIESPPKGAAKQSVQRERRAA